MTTDTLPDPGSRTPAKVFLSYCHADPNAGVVQKVYSALKERHEVFVDNGITSGTPWSPETDVWLAKADYFVVFLSAEAAKSHGVAEEVRRAVKRRDETGRPTILTVPLDYDIDELGYGLSALVRDFQFGLLWQKPEDTSDLIDDLERVISGARVAPATEIVFALAQYMMSDARRKRIGETFVPPPDIEKARALIRERRVVWITGAAGVGKQFLASALACELNGSVFELRPTLSWRHIFRYRPVGSVLVLPDALAPDRAGSDDYEAALKKLLQICESDNTVLLTCSDDEYRARHGDLLDAGFTTATLTPHTLSKDLYSLPLRSEIIRKLATQKQSEGIVSTAQGQWIETLLSGRKELAWRDWTLGELESFVIRSLPATASLDDVDQLLDRHTTIEDQVHVWFLGLDAAAQALLLALLLFPETSPEQLWARFRDILSELESLRLVPRMSIPTLGVCRARCKPYVTATDEMGIVDSDLASAIARELAVSWREYVIELQRLLKEWAIPPAGQDSDLTRTNADKRAPVRKGVARLLGELMRIRVEDVQPFLDEFATFDQIGIRRAAAEAIVYTFGTQDGARNGRKLLRAWESDRQGKEADARRREVVADACWRIASFTTDSTSYRFALEQLQRLTFDVPMVRSTVAYGIGKIVKRRHDDELLWMMTRLARDKDEIVRRRAGVALDELGRRAPGEASKVFAEWLASKEAKRLWTGAYALLVTRAPRPADRDKLHTLMRLDPVAFAGALASSLASGDDIKDTDRTKHARDNVIRLATDPESAALCATALGSYWTAHPDREGPVLCERLARIGETSVDALLVGAYWERFSRATSLSLIHEMVLADVAAGEARRRIATQATASILEWTDDAQRVVVAAAWQDVPELFERFLRWVSSDLGEAGRNAAVRQRRLILESLCPQPKTLVKCAATWLRDPATRSEVLDALRAIVDNRDVWLRVATPLALEYWDSRDDVWPILGVLGADHSIAVRHLAFARLLEESPRRFVAAAIEETQKFEALRAEVLAALAQLSGKKADAMADAIRQSVTPTNRRDVRTLIHVFKESGTALTEVAEALWFMRFRLWFLELFSGSGS